jgi:hypothetical protein
MKLPESETLSADPAAANRRFRFIFTDIGKGSDEVSTGSCFPNWVATITITGQFENAS